jgi:hypothetical protein
MKKYDAEVETLQKQQTRPSGWYWVKRKVDWKHNGNPGEWEPARWDSESKKFSSVEFSGVQEMDFEVGLKVEFSTEFSTRHKKRA